MPARKPSLRRRSNRSLPAFQETRRRGGEDAAPVADRGASITTSAIVDALYQGILDREPDEAGRNQYLRSIADGLNLDEAVKSILHSDEAALQRFRTAREPFWQAREGRPARPVCFLHILKTGGTALVNGLRRIVRPELCLDGLFLDHLVGVPDYVLDGSALIAGHLPYEAVDLLPAHGLICTVLRHPLERTLSHYAHLSRDPAVRRSQPDLSLERFVLAPEWRPLSSNHQARQLVHRVGVATAWRDFSPRQRLESMGFPCPPEFRHPLDALFHCSPMELPDGELRDRASETLRSIELVGVTERLDRLFLKLAASLGVTDPPPLLPENVGSNRLQRDEVPTAVAEMILEQNAVDLELHGRALAMQHRLEPAPNAEPAGSGDDPGQRSSGCRSAAGDLHEVPAVSALHE